MEKLLAQTCNPDTISPLTLAFVGDGVYDLMVREHLVIQANRPVGKLNKKKVDLVCCKTQAESAKMLVDSLTEQEQAVYKRGRNATTSNTPKNAKAADYHSATGLEALFGYLYLKGESERIKELFGIILQNREDTSE